MVLLALSVGLAGCDDFFSAEITGFLRRERTVKVGESSEVGAGINGAELRVFLEEPESFDDPDFVAHTTTLDNRSAGIELPGFYRTSVVWESSSADFGDSGDLRSVWIATSHPDYGDRVVEFDAVQSSTINVLPEILLRGLRVGPELIRGEVHLDGAGIDGVRVVLTFDELDEMGVDFEGRTQTVDGQPGVYALKDVLWDASDGTEVTGTVTVTDPNYISAGPVTVALQADQAIVVSEPIAVRSSFFDVRRVRGRVVDEFGQGVNGVRIVLRPENARDGSHPATVSTQVEGQSGVYQFIDTGWSLPSKSELVDTYDTQKIELAVEDDAYVQASAGRELAVMVGYQQELDVSEELVVTRRPRSEFAAVVQGRCVEAIADEAVLRGVAGVEVTAVFTDGEGDHTLVARTDPDGQYSLFTEWRRDGASGGEDEISIELGFSAVDRDGSRLVFEPVTYVVRSWMRPNQVPDAIAAIDEEVDGGI